MIAKVHAIPPLEGRFSPLLDGVYTIQSPKGEHRTFRVQTVRERKTFAGVSSFMDGKRVLSLLTGPDNGSDFLGFAFVDDYGVGIWRRFRSGHPFDVSGWDPSWSDHEKMASMLWDLFGAHGRPSSFAALGYVLLWSGKCARCGRRLTTPESIQRGLGPVCEGRG